jgi:hypothetical protein
MNTVYAQLRESLKTLRIFRLDAELCALFKYVSAIKGQGSALRHGEDR